MQYSKLKVGLSYKIKTNSNIKLNEIGFTSGTCVKLEHILFDWMYVFICRGAKIAVRKSELNGIDFRICKE